MGRLIGPDEASRKAETIVDGTFRAKPNRPATVYADPAATQLADILHLDGTPIPDSVVTTDAYSMLPLFQFPDGADTVWVVGDGGPAWPIYARTDDRLDALGGRVGTVEGVAAAAETPAGAQAKASAAQVAAIAASAQRAANLSDLANAATARTNLGAQPRIVVTFGTTEADYLAAADSTASFQSAIDALSALGGGDLHVKRGTYTLGTVTLKQGVSIIAERGTAFTLKSGAGTMFVSNGFASASRSGVGLAGINKFELRGFVINGNSANQTDSGAGDYADRNALIKLYGWQYRIQDVHLYDAKEVALYTEHAFAWEATLNDADFAEAIFSEIFIKNYGVVGWVHRGPHDSHARNVLISSRNASGLHALYGLVVESDSVKYGPNGFIATAVHVWGDHTQNAVLISKCNLLMSTLYAEGSSGAAIRVTGGGQNDFQAFVAYAAHGVRLDNTGDNSITVSVGAGISGSAFKPEVSVSGNRLALLHGTPVTSVFDLSTYTNTSAFNTFASRSWNTTPFSGGSPVLSDRVDVVADFASQSSRVTWWKLPVQGTRVEVTNAGLDLGGLPIINAATDAFAAGQSTIPREFSAASSTLATTSGTLQLVYFTATRSETWTKIQVFSGGTVAGPTPTLVRVGLYAVAANGDLTLVASCASDTTVLAGTFSGYTRSLTSSYAATAGARYAWGFIIVTATTLPTLSGSQINDAVAAVAPRKTGKLTGQTDLPSSISAASVAITNLMPYGALLP